MKKLLIRAVVITSFIIGCFVGGILLVNFVMSFMVGRGDEVMVPDLRGMDIVEARRLVQEQDLALTIVGQRFSEDTGADLVLQQTPTPGRKMKRSRPIEVTTSLGPELAGVPELRNIGLNEAMDILRQEGLEPGEVTRAHVGDVAVNAVVLSRPRAGEWIRKGTTVTLLVSNGPEPVAWVMPDLRGRSESRARHMVSELGLTAYVTQSHEEGEPPGAVIRQVPAPGERVVQGDRVELTVAN